MHLEKKITLKITPQQARRLAEAGTGYIVALVSSVWDMTCELLDAAGLKPAEAGMLVWHPAQPGNDNQLLKTDY